MSWVYVDDHLSGDMSGTCTCMHIHAPNMQLDRESPRGDDSEEQRKNQRKRSSHTPKPKTYTYKTLRLADLPSDVEWWAARVAQFPGVNLLEELSKAQDWSGAHKIKNAKIFFRNWLAKVPATEAQDLTPDQARARLAIV